MIPALAASGVLVGATVLAGAGPALAGGSSGSGSVAIPQGVGAEPLTGLPPEGTTPGSTPVTVSFVLNARNLGQLQDEVQRGWRGPYLSVSQFASQYGQSPEAISALERYLDSYGLTTTAAADGLDVVANGTAAQVNAALTVQLQQYDVTSPGATPGSPRRHYRVHGSRANPQLPRSLAGSVLAILGLSNYAPFATQSVKAVARQVGTPASAPADTIPAGLLTPADFASDYGLTPLTNNGAEGQGTTIGIVTLAALDENDPLTFWNDYLGLNESPSRITIDNVDGGPGAPSLTAGSDETTLDVEQSGALAPAANVRVYQAPNTDYGFVDAFIDAASDNIADTVSASWGESETYLALSVENDEESPAYAQAFDEAYLEMAAQGQSGFVSAGDNGAYDAQADAGTTNLSADNPQDSPYITSAGGTTLPGTQTYPVLDSSGNPTGATESANIPREQAWNWGYLWPLYQALGLPDIATAASDLAVGGGGGYSVLEPEPSYQRGVVESYNDREYLTPTDVQSVMGAQLPTAFALNENPSLDSGQDSGSRAVPDVSTNADPQTGYAVYSELFSSPIEQFGGTSFVAPQLNGSTAVIDSALGHRVGFWNPQIYSFAQSRNSPFTPLNSTRVYGGVNYLYSQASASAAPTALPGTFSNDNLFYTGQRGAIWNPASGLGTPDLAALAADFARH